MSARRSSRRVPSLRRAWAFASACVAAVACGGDPPAMPGPAGGPPRAATVSSTLALAVDERTLWVVNPDADSVSLLDPVARRLVAEIPLADGPPTVDPATQRYEPRVRPRALALLPDGATLYVAGQASGRLHVVDTATRAVRRSLPMPLDPVGVVAAPDGSAVYVVSHEAGVVTRVDPRTDTVTGTLAVGDHPFGATVSADGKTLFVTRLLLHAGVAAVDTATFTLRASLDLVDQPTDPVGGRRVPSGVPRGVYVAVPRPSTPPAGPASPASAATPATLWLPHLLLGVATPQPQLDFESTVFPTVSTVGLDASGRPAEGKRLLFQPLSVPGARGSFSDSVSGPRALAFTPDGKLALLLLAQSEDLLVLDGATGNEVSLVRPLPGALLEGIVVDAAGRHAWVDGRNSHDVTVLALHPDDAVAPVTVDGPPIDRLAHDPMPADLRLGQRLFFGANSAAFPITRNFWVACSSCHIEGGSDAVTWRFAQGPRDTPSNAGGTLHTGFLFRQATRSSVVQYDKTVRIEQGGTMSRDLPSQRPLLDALAAFVDRALPLPGNPHRASDGTLDAAQTRGRALFADRCAGCHGGDWFTDSGAGNPTLDLAHGEVRLHDVGTCRLDGPFPDRVATDDVAGTARAACAFDTPTLRGVFATPPYLHDGSAATLADAIARHATEAALSQEQRADLVAYVETL